MDPQMVKTIQDYFKTQPVLKAWVFGSYARGEETEDSDVDILVDLDYSKPVGLEFVQMQLDLQSIRTVKFVK
ncbi:MAG: nucleotidyltransferase domain-containing protein [Bacteroidales bacterium]|nr:nucleotidyltransferase domain-containing protein [Bacteroidales bacterium]